VNQIRRRSMRVMVFAKTPGRSESGTGSTPEDLAAFKAIDEFTKTLVKAGVPVAATGLG
jgi:hypothetical protein